ncbi:MAG: acyl carrier protein [Acidimicrobiales bacterium]
MNPTPEDVRRHMAKLLERPEAKVATAAVLTDLVADSFRLVELAIELQDDFDVVLTQADLSVINTVGDLAQLVASRARG